MSIDINKLANTPISPHGLFLATRTNSRWRNGQIGSVQPNAGVIRGTVASVSVLIDFTRCT